MYVGRYVGMYVGRYVCMYVCVYIYNIDYTYTWPPLSNLHPKIAPPTLVAPSESCPKCLLRAARVFFSPWMSEKWWLKPPKWPTSMKIWGT